MKCRRNTVAAAALAVAAFFIRHGQRQVVTCWVARSVSFGEWKKRGKCIESEGERASKPASLINVMLALGSQHLLPRQYMCVHV